jgi:hypothetical protein
LEVPTGSICFALNRFCGGSVEALPEGVGEGEGVGLRFPRSNFGFDFSNGAESGTMVDLGVADAGMFCNSFRLLLPNGVVTGEADALGWTVGVLEARG